jgi:hypothetical protein
MVKNNVDNLFKLNLSQRMIEKEKNHDEIYIYIQTL